MDNISHLSTQKIHKMGIDFAIEAAKSHNDLLIQSRTYPDQFVVDTEYGLRDVVFCCSTKHKNKDRINCNISKKENQNRTTMLNEYSNKFYILVHMDLENNINRFFKISHTDLCMLVYKNDCIRTNNPNMTIKEWLCNGCGRNNISIESLVSGGYEVWNN